MRGDTEGATVLVVDDNEAIADTYTAFLADSFDVRTAYSGSEALEAVDADVDVVVLDRRMPDVSGDEVLAEIDERSLECRVVMLTAVDPGFDIVDMPFDQYVVKPVERAELNAVVDEMLERANYDDEFRQFLALASKKATLEREHASADLDASEQYDRIRARLEEKRDELVIETDDVEGIFTGDVADIVPGEGLSTGGLDDAGDTENGRE